MERPDFLNLITTLEGYKPNLKMLHWNAPNTAMHVLAADVADLLSDFQDAFAEQGFTVWGKFAFGEFNPSMSNHQDLCSLIVDAIETLTFARGEFEYNQNLASFAAIIDDTVAKLRTKKYLCDFNV